MANYRLMPESSMIHHFVSYPSDPSVKTVSTGREKLDIKEPGQI